MKHNSELDKLPRLVYSIVVVGFLVVVLNTVFLYKLTRDNAELEQRLNLFHLPNATLLSNALIEIGQIRFINRYGTGSTGLPVSLTMESLDQHRFLIDDTIKAVLDVQKQYGTPTFIAPVQRLKTRFERWVISLGGTKHGSLPADLQTDALERLKYSVKQLHRLHLRELRSLSSAVQSNNQQQASRIMLVSFLSLLLGGVIVYRVFGHIFSSIRIQRKNEQDLHDYRNNLEELVEARTTDLKQMIHESESFSYSVSHDLRSPLRAIDGFSKALQEDYHGQLDEQASSYLDRIRRASQRMGELIDDLLALSRVSRHELVHRDIDLCQLAHEIVHQYQSRHPDAHIEFDCAASCTGRGDERLLRLALDNLLTNAIKFSQKQPVSQIEFGHYEYDEGPVFFVRDNGVGFDMQYVGKLFGAFQRLHTDKEFEGTGIGLATVERIIHRHHGRIWAESKAGQGASFFFTLHENTAIRPD